MANAQIRNVPDDLHRILEAKTASEGSFIYRRMSDYKDTARSPSVEEAAARILAEAVPREITAAS